MSRDAGALQRDDIPKKEHTTHTKTNYMNKIVQISTTPSGSTSHEPAKTLKAEKEIGGKKSDGIRPAPGGYRSAPLIVLVARAGHQAT